MSLQTQKGAVASFCTNHIFDKFSYFLILYLLYKLAKFRIFFAFIDELEK